MCYYLNYVITDSEIAQLQVQGSVGGQVESSREGITLYRTVRTLLVGRFAARVKRHVT